MNSLLKALIVLNLGLAACTSCPDTDTVDLSDVSAPLAFAGKADSGDLMVKDRNTVWMKRVAVYSTDQTLQTQGAKLVQLREGIHLVPVSQSHFLIRLVPHFDTKRPSFHVSTQFNGEVTEGPDFPGKVLKGNGKKQDEKAQDGLMAFVEDAMAKAQKRTYEASTK